VAETLSMKGGTPKATMPFLKKMGFVGADGAPTDRYKTFRNEARSGAAVAEAMKELYSPLFAKNENAQDLAKSDLVGLIVETTGGEKDAQVTKLTVATFNALRAMADFKTVKSRGATQKRREEAETDKPGLPAERETADTPNSPIHLSYTINLNLPPTSDIDVFNAIFKSLREHLLDR
jgi:hypothetical protein